MNKGNSPVATTVSRGAERHSRVPSRIRGILNPPTFYRRAGKRMFDLLAALFGTLLLSPLFLLIAAAIRLTSVGPVLFRQTRIGRGGAPFTLFKFRTMLVPPAGPGDHITAAGDPRITAVGGLLRRLKLDELPQLLNILRGDMSFVGPRPQVPEKMAGGVQIPEELLSLRPGLTGLSTLCDRTEELNLAAIPPEDRERFYSEHWLPRKQRQDLLYAHKLSLGLDLKLVLLTLLLLFFPGTGKEREVRVLGVRFNLFSKTVQQAIDFVIFALAVVVAFWIRYEGHPGPGQLFQLYLFLLLLPFVRVFANRAMGVYDLVWRYISLSDALLVLVSLAIVSCILLLVRLSVPRFFLQAAPFSMPLTIICAEFLLSAAGTLGVRILRRNLYETGISFQPQSVGPLRVLLVGAGFLGSTVARQMRKYPDFDPLGFLDDDPRKLGKRISGMRVLGTTDELISLAQELGVEHVFICLGGADESKVANLLGTCAASHLRATVVPDLIALLDEG